MPKKALITGITGQDGAYLTELLLDEGYEVYGIIRRSSSFNTSRIDHIYQDPHERGARLKLIYGDLSDASCLSAILARVRPDEVYNLGAQSHVRVSFDTPEYTGDVTGLGTVRLLEAIRQSDLRPRFYQASSSELYGKVREVPQKETTPFYPRSPYACAKAYAFYITVNYRESYGLHASNGILFNHECVSERTPLLVRRDGVVDVEPAAALVPLLRKGPSTQQFEAPGLEVWDGQGWTPVTGITATRRRTRDDDHRMLSLEARAGIVEATAHHRMIRADGGVCAAVEVQAGDRLALTERFPEAPGTTLLTPELAELFGHLASEGWVPPRGVIRYTNNDPALRARVADLWLRLFLGHSSEWTGRSGFAPDRPVVHLNLLGRASLCEWLRDQLYTREGFKRVPALVLNSTPELQARFLDSYYEGDGLKAGNGDSVKTNSAVLAQGLYWLYAIQGRLASVYAEHRDGRVYYTLNLPSATPAGQKGQHLRKDPAEVRRVEAGAECEWVFDLATGSGVFCAGVGRVVVHNSPRRGETFVTRKVTRGLARIKHGLQDKLFLGNLDARRDWGFAGDYVRAMWLMLQQPEPDDYVIATGEAHSVRELLDVAAAHLGLDWQKHVEIDPRYFRPAEVDLLVGDATRARTRLGWAPTVGFKELVVSMVEADLQDVEREKYGTHGRRPGYVSDRIPVTRPGSEHEEEDHE